MTKNKQQQVSGEAKVVYVRKEHAKAVKNRLKESGFLDDRFRMLPAVSGSSILVVENDPKSFIAIPISDEFVEERLGLSDEDNGKELESLSGRIVGLGCQTCPYSTRLLGNGRANHQPMEKTKEKFSLIQSVILGITSTPTMTDRTSGTSLMALDPTLVDRVLKLGSTVCPGSRRRQSLEIFGDDRTVVVPPGAFEGEEFLCILRDVHKHNLISGNNSQQPTTFDDEDTTRFLYQDFWHRLAIAHDSTRVVRRGGIDPNSKIRESGHRLVWSENKGITAEVGPDSPTWIRVTEQGVKQSFDFSQVMFSRGNISEKIRFGKQLVREGDVVLDMYSGIGYYTLPAVIHGRAAKVYACEWNEHAITALRFNIRDNKIEDKVQIFVGDCRQSAQKHNLVGLVDRVSLGLLPSSEGGWRTAVRALKVDSGGWLHVHANVPSAEMETWTLWLCHKLKILAHEEGKPDDWWVLCDHVERVKSFAPTVFHYVADVFVGTPSEVSYPRGYGFVQEQMTSSDDSRRRAWMKLRSSDQNWIPVLDENVARPSCALSPDGILSQEWMR